MTETKQLKKAVPGEEILPVLNPDIAAYVRRVHRYINGRRRGM